MMNAKDHNSMELIHVNDYVQEKECIYKGERYSVRDNGAVLRHQRTGKRFRSNDNQWTFGVENSSNPYLHIASVRIHRIVATAFHGDPIDPQYVVDHIDTNCRNNRPENLRWLSRLDNALKNPVTRKKIEQICGSIEAFLANPSILNAYRDMKDISWMRTVTPEEAKNCRERMSLWADSDTKPSGGTFGEWVYKPLNKSETLARILKSDITTTVEISEISKTSKHLDKNKYETLRKRSFARLNDQEIYYNEMLNEEVELVKALTNNCVQKDWRVPSYFPCCPEELGMDPLESYFQNLIVGAVFSYNDKYPQSTILQFVKNKEGSSILIMCEKDGMKPWSVAEVTFVDGVFVHANLGSFFDKNGAEKTFCIEQGLGWTGGDAFDDYC